MLRITISLDPGRARIEDGVLILDAEHVTVACHLHSLKERFTPPEAVLVEGMRVFRIEGKEVEFT